MRLCVIAREPRAHGKSKSAQREVLTTRPDASIPVTDELAQVLTLVLQICHRWDYPFGHELQGS